VKVHHRKTHWIHVAFSISLLTLLAALILIKQTLPTAVLAGAFALYVLGNGYIHAKRDDLKQETIIEYILLAAAVFIVLVSALKTS
jgi:hypothetical protein